MSTLVLLRHGQSRWNLENRCTGWYDVDVTQQSVDEAIASRNALAAANMRPYWFDAIIPDLQMNDTVKHLSNIGDQDISSLNIPTGVPLVYEIDSQGRPTSDTPVEDRYLT